VQGPTGPTKKQLVTRIQELEIHFSNSKLKVKHLNTFYRDRAKLENFFRGLDVYFTTHYRMNKGGKILFIALLLQDTAAS
jgi:hypothetical protein